MMKVIDPVQLQRLIDGELGIEEVQQIVAIMEPKTNQWKSIATGFIENQMLQSQFEALEPDHSPDVDYEPRSDSNSVSIPHGWLLSLAASALLTLSIGMMIGANYFADDATPYRAPLVASSSGQLIGENETNQPANNPAVYRMQLQDQEGNRFIDTDIPFYQVTNWDDVGRHKFKEYPADVRDRVLNSGYDLQQDTKYLRGRLKDGRKFIIPIRNTKFAPYQ